MPVTPLSSPSTSSRTWFQRNSTLPRLAGEESVLQDLLGAQGVAAVHEGDFLGDVGQVQGFLDRRVAAADDRDALPR
jgi:hypothetical protein